MEMLDSEEKKLDELYCLKQKRNGNVKASLPDAKSFYLEEVR